MIYFYICAYIMLIYLRRRLESTIKNARSDRVSLLSPEPLSRIFRLASLRRRWYTFAGRSFFSSHITLLIIKLNAARILGTLFRRHGRYHLPSSHQLLRPESHRRFLQKSFTRFHRTLDEALRKCIIEEL